MDQRPAIGERVRVLAKTGMKDTTGKRGEVIAHFPDGVAFRVRLEADAREMVCDPVNVEPVIAHA